MDYQKLLYEIRDDVALIRLNDRATLNAMSIDMGIELADALARGAREAGAIILGSTGRSFCSGAFLGQGRFDLDDTERDVGDRMESLFNPLILAIRDLDVPIVTAVKGAAAGIGCSLALMGDIIVASEDAFFLQAFRNIGLVPDSGSAYILAKAIGRVRAMEMMLLGEKLPAQRGYEWGLVTRLVPNETLEEDAFALAETLARGPFSQRHIRTMAWAALDGGLPEQLARERTIQRDVGRSDDFAEGVRAFREKRPPRFRRR